MQSKRKKQGLNSPSERELKRFVRSDVGQAMIEFVPVLFIKLEQFDQTNSKLAGLKIPLGLVRMSLELITGYNGGFDNADTSLSKEKADKLRAACEDENCQFKTSQFSIDNNGMFNIMTGVGKTSKKQKAELAASCEFTSNPFKQNSLITTLAEENCHGMCGLGCFTPFDIKTKECMGHDDCVDAFSHAACLFDSHGEGFNSLLEAIWSYTVVLFTGSEITQGEMKYSTSVFTGEGSNYYSPSVGEFCSYDIYCIDRSGLGFSQDPF